ncbi:D-2-hydroxyacid dehydrogenase family protein [Marinibacterium sp. SX1]|uniref:D-2-hydroxyacid dehydrogenase family protein n=1 Tax=Marinibacterium sp. SX1 TaxID=3388424 RepID=UPI003D16F5FB
MKIHILDDWHDTLRGLPCFARLAGHDVTVWTDHVDDPAVLADRLAPAEGLVLFRERTAITADLLGRLPGLRLISQRGAYPHVDVAACTAGGVMLCSNQKGDGGYSVAAAELTFALMLACARQLPAQVASLKAGGWQLAPGQTLAGRVLGLYGYGRIARAVARYAEAFGMEVIWWASEAGRARAAADGVRLADSRAEFFARADMVSLHQRLTPTTRATITAEDLALMKPTASLINTARAGLIAPGALLDALRAGRPGRAGIDVFDTEPLTDVDDPLLALPNLVATPHIGFVTEDELDKQFADIFDQVNAFARGAPIHVINPEVAPTGRS